MAVDLVPRKMSFGISESRGLCVADAGSLYLIHRDRGVILEIRGQLSFLFLN